MPRLKKKGHALHQKVAPAGTKLTRFAYVLKKSDFSEEYIKALKKELIVKPFKPGKFALFAKNTAFSLYTETETHLGIPKFFGINRIGMPEDNKLEAYDYPQQDIVYNGEMRPNQVPIIEKVLKGFDEIGGGMLIAGCGIGKTNMAIYLSCLLKAKTLFLVHKEFLMRQFVNRVKAFTNVEEVGIIQQKKVKTDFPFVVGMIQSIARRDYPHEIFKDFELIIIDEAHHMGSKHYSKVLQKLTAKRTLGITAEHERKDKLFHIINWYLGPILHQEPQKPNDMVIVKRFFYKTKKEKYMKMLYNKFTHEVNRSSMITNLCRISRRNKFIINLILEFCDQDKKILCLGGRIKQIMLMYEILEANPLTKGNVGLYLGGMKEAALARSATKQIIFGTYEMASEGLDIPDLNVEILMTPKTTINQCVGRILRKDVYVESPIVVDIIDDNEVFTAQSKRRQHYYRSQEYNIQDFYVSESRQDIDTHKLYTDNEFIREALLKEIDLTKRKKKITDYVDKDNQESFDGFDSDNSFDAETVEE